MGAWSRLDSIVFESLADACSPLAIVKSHTDQRVVLRMRGGLLPLRNPRRAVVQAGTILQLVSNIAASVPVGSPPARFVIVEKVDGHLLECRSPGPLSDLGTEDAADRWIAVGVQPRHAVTEFSLTMAEPTPGAPLTGCDIWSSDRLASPGTYLGRTDDRGAIVAAAADGVRWLHVRWGTVLLEQFPVVPGWGAHQQLVTHIRPATLAMAAALAECQDDVTELAALRGVYLARAQARERAGKTAESASLREECQTLLQERVPELRNLIRQRRHRAAQQSPDPEVGVDIAWRALEDALSQLLPAEAKKSP
jgi:hypothetical protein